jgi:hypothetical protein
VRLDDSRPYFTTFSAPYSPQQNKVVDPQNLTIVGMAQFMMKATKMPVVFWGEAVNTAVFILNPRTPRQFLHFHHAAIVQDMNFGSILLNHHSSS